ncbi:MAG: prolyl oligopeptidase family serine peptidase [Micrococcus sp.]|nr:prolyl oligopeptidase family serine peptidase [Micrococcus sp.]
MTESTTLSSRAASTVFHDLDQFVAQPRLSGLTLSPDGTRLVTTVATLNAKGTGYASALWEVDPAGEQPAYRLTRSAEGEAGASFAADGSLFFTSARPDPQNADAEKSAALWRLPARGGEARLVLARPGGISGVQCAAAADTVLISADRLLGARTEAEHAERAEQRKTAGVDAILHTGFPVRFWDHDLGPAAPELFILEDGPDPQGTPDASDSDDGADGQSASATDSGPATASAASAPTTTSPTDTTTDHSDGHHLRHVSDFPRSRGFDLDARLSPDGSFLLTVAATARARADMSTGRLVRVDTATGEHTVLLDETGEDVGLGAISHDGTRAIITRTPHTTYAETMDLRQYVLDTTTGETTPLAHDWDRWGDVVGWLPDDSAVIALADDDGRAHIFRIEVPSGEVTRLTHEDEAWTDVVIAPDGATLYGLRSSYRFPAEVARIDLASGKTTTLPGPAERPEIPGTLEDVETTTDDGTRVRGWLALPEGEAPEGGWPLLLFIHGGPVSSFNAWTWRWCPWIMTAQGYAVLMPDPALSTGYGRDFVQRGWGSWGTEPYEDLMAITDAVEARADIDPSRTAALGGSFGGYMANWVAGHTDRFRAIVTHASLWALEGFDSSTDAAFYWRREMSEEMRQANSPHQFVGDIITPMLVIHGDKDYRVPIHEGLRLWYDLLSASGLPAGEDGSTEHRFLYFPQENHWILSPQHAKVWYRVVSDFLNENVLGHDTAAPPAELGL